MSELNFAAQRLAEIYQDLESKALFNAEAAITIMEELEKVWLGPAAAVQPARQLAEDPSLPGKSCAELIAWARSLRGEPIRHLPAFTAIFALQASLYRYQSL